MEATVDRFDDLRPRCHVVAACARWMSTEEVDTGGACLTEVAAQ